MDDRELMFLSAHEQQVLLAAGDVSSTELTHAALRRIDKLDPRINAFITVDAEGALQAAKEADSRISHKEPLPALNGIPVCVKDLEATRGLRTTFGSKLFEQFVPEEDSVAVERVRRAGAVILGKTNTPEFGGAADTYTDIFPACNNPWDVSRTSGGSSGGTAAAVAAGMCSIGVGSDGGGSIRLPAAWCGIYGYKATHGLIPHTGSIGQTALNLTATSGPMTRSVRDAALLLGVLAGHDARDPGSLRLPPPDFASTLDAGIKGLRVAWALDLGFATIEESIEQSMLSAVETFNQLGAKTERVNVALAPHPFETFWPVLAAGRAAAYRDLYEEAGSEMMPYTRDQIEYGLSLSAAEVWAVLRQVQQLRMEIDGLFDEHDLLLVPVTAVSAWRHLQPPNEIRGRPITAEYSGIRYGAIPFPQAFSLTGNPCASVPGGFDDDGLPIGLQFVGRHQDDITVLRASQAFERLRPWDGTRPPVS